MKSHGASAVYTSQQTSRFFIPLKGANLIICSLLVLVLILSSCAPTKVHLDEAGYVIGQDNYAFAIYTGDGNLLTHPLEHFRQRQSAQPDKPFSDVYVISHGWNFTIPEAIANYHSYIEIINQKMKTNSFDKDFRPFFIFVVWNSVTRPLTDATRAILPYGLDSSLGILTATVDKFLFFLPSVWKQSVNASTIALGQDLPEQYRMRHTSNGTTVKSTLGCFNEHQLASCYGVEAKAMGSDYPVSALLYDLFEEKNKGPRPFGIHVIGHSYGAKIAALASMEALRRWQLDRSQTSRDQSPLASLLLINPAMNPREFDYLVDFSLPPFDDLKPPEFADVEHLLQRIPRKGIVYSNYDYPNGLFFDMSQTVLNNDQMQRAQFMLHYVRDRQVDFTVRLLDSVLSPLENLLPDEDRRRQRAFRSALYGVLYDLSMPPAAAYQLGLNVVAGTVSWSMTKLINTPFDFLYHLQHNRTFPESDSRIFEAIRYTFNALHFFVPIDRLLWPGQPADQLGLFRPTKPGIGKGGLNKTGNGRYSWLNVGPLEDFVDDTTDIAPRTFCALARTVYKQGADLRDTAPVLKPTRIYSFDASTVFDGSPLLPIGSHGDVGSNELKDCNPTEPLPSKMEKREYSANFIFNFTKVLGQTNDPPPLLQTIPERGE